MSAALETLCLACGFCCDGTLFVHAPLTPDEVPALRALGVGLVTRRDKSTSIRQGCSALLNRCCQVYAARPATCRKFVCTLGLRLSREAVSLPQALEVVTAAQAKLTALAQVLPAPPAGDNSGALMHARTGAQQGTVEITPAVRAAWDVAEDFVLANFLRPAP